MSPNQLSDQFKHAHILRDYDRIADLVYWDGARKPMRKKVEVYTTATFGLNIRNIEIQPVAQDQFSDFRLGTKALKPNLPVSHIMKVHFDRDAEHDQASEKNTTVYLIGKRDDRYMISVYVNRNRSTQGHHD